MVNLSQHIDLIIIMIKIEFYMYFQNEKLYRAQCTKMQSDITIYIIQKNIT